MKIYNEMCKNCMRLNADCEGCTNEVYSGCVYKVESKKEENTMMKSQFAQAVAEKVNGEVKEVEKANGVIFTGIQIKNGMAIAPVVYIDAFYDEGMNVDETAEKVKDLASDSMSDVSFINADTFTNWEAIKPKLRARLYNERTNADIKRPAGYGFDDLVIIPYIELFTDGDVKGSVKVTNELLKMWKVTADDVINVAEENSKNDVVIRPMSEVIAEIMGMPPMPMVDDELFVVSNNSKLYGAYAVIAGYEALKERFPNGFTVLPSSVHEVLVTGLSDDGFSDVVQGVNDCAVDPQEVLGNKAYRVE